MVGIEAQVEKYPGESTCEEMEGKETVGWRWRGKEVMGVVMKDQGGGGGEGGGGGG